MISTIVRAWNKFFFTPQPPVVLALYRIAFSAIVLLDLFLVYPDWLTWFGDHALLSLSSLPAAERASQLNIFAIWPRNDTAMLCLFWIMVAFAVFLLVGFMSRGSSVMVFIALLSLHKRNPMILSGGDTLLRLDAFFLMFAPTGAALSVDRFIQRFRGRQQDQPILVLPWAQRMIQIQTALVYLSTFFWKLLGDRWIDGTALYYVLHLSEFKQFVVPGANHITVIQLMTWSTLVIELSLGTLVWFRHLKYWVLLAGICLHAAIEYALNIPLFSFTMVATYVTFVDYRDLEAVRSWFRPRRRVLSPG
ncbi:MAG TPA: HTTM domain-containing protein [Bryobacteraceae bacterium]|nr:HTTM domain-containing protein [Bryobacteraceae bacterium]